MLTAHWTGTGELSGTVAYSQAVQSLGLSEYGFFLNPSASFTSTHLAFLSRDFQCILGETVKSLLRIPAHSYLLSQISHPLLFLLLVFCNYCLSCAFAKDQPAENCENRGKNLNYQISTMSKGSASRLCVALLFFLDKLWKHEMQFGMMKTKEALKKFKAMWSIKEWIDFIDNFNLSCVTNGG